MDTTTEPCPSPDPTRSGALWVAGTGAFLLILAAAVFVAVRWDDIPDGVKLGTVALLTGVFLTAGRGLRRSLPATSGVLFHVGAFLVPIDVAAVGVHLGFDWPALLAVQGAVGLIVFPLFCRVDATVPLRWAVGAAGLVWAAGAAALSAGTGVPHISVGLALSGLAVVGLVAGRDRLATVWAAAAGATPLLAWAPSAIPPYDPDLHDRMTEIVEHLGIAPPPFLAAPVVAGVLAATVLTVVARRRTDVGLLALAGSSLALGVGATWIALEPAPATTVAGLAAVFVLIELGALFVGSDPFWSRAFRPVTAVVEVGAIYPVVVAGVAVVFAPIADWWWDQAETSLVITFGLLALGWFVADLRRRCDDGRSLSWAVLFGAGWPPATVAVSVCTVAASLWAGGQPAATGAMVAVSLLCVVSGRGGGHALASVFAVWAPVTALRYDGWLAAGSAAIGALLVAEAAVARARLGHPDRHQADHHRADHDQTHRRQADVAWGLAFVALVPVALTGVGAGLETSRVGGMLAAIVTAWAVAVSVDRGSDRWTDGLGLPARLLALTTLVWVPQVAPEQAVVIAGLLSGLAVGDGLRTGDRRIAYGAAVSVPVLVVSGGLALDVPRPFTGVGLCLAAVVATGVAALVVDEWQPPVLATAAATLGAGLIIGAADAEAFAPCLIIAGGLVLAMALVVRSSELSVIGGVVTVAGVWLQLAVAGVAASDAYAAPVTALLVGLGVSVRHGRGADRPSSWVAYGPAVVLLAGTALVERMAGGSGWHALVAGAVGATAVVAGGSRRLGAPLLLGTAVVVVTAGYESLVITRDVPTWAWLALGGSLLLGAGVAMERHEVGPVETGRRLVDVIQDRYS